MKVKITDQQPSQKNFEALKIIVGGICGMVVVMGIGRFAFTPILPLMQRDLGVSNTLAGWLAGLNYLGYLLGAVICIITPPLIRSRTVASSALLLSIATTFLMSLTVSEFWWSVLRLVGGFVSAVMFVIISAEVGGTLIKRGHGHWVGAIYGGIGLGIALSGLIVFQLDKIGGWDAAWAGMGIIAVIAAVFACYGIIWGQSGIYKAEAPSGLAKLTANLSSIWILNTAYFLEGMGYIVTATFIVAIIAATPGLEVFASYSWVFVGLAAVPSTIFWPYLARRIGTKKALLAAYALQSAGIIISIQAESVIEVMFAALSFGGTFLGIVALTLSEGNMRLGKDGGRAAAILTVSFSVGQMIGPIIAGKLADYQNSFALPLSLAALCVILGGILTAIDRDFATEKIKKGG